MGNEIDYYARKNRSQRHPSPSLPDERASQHYSQKPPGRSKSRSREDHVHHQPIQGRRVDYPLQELPSQHLQSKSYKKANGIQRLSKNHPPFLYPTPHNKTQLKSVLKTPLARSGVPNHVPNGGDAKDSSSDELSRQDDPSSPTGQQSILPSGWLNPWHVDKKRKPSPHISNTPLKARKHSQSSHAVALADGSVDGDSYSDHERRSENRGRSKPVSRGRDSRQELRNSPPKTTTIITIDDDGNEQILHMPVDQLRHARQTTDNCPPPRRSSSVHPSMSQGGHMSNGLHERHLERARSRQSSLHPISNSRRSQSVARGQVKRSSERDVKYHLKSEHLHSRNGENHISGHGYNDHCESPPQPFILNSRQLDARASSSSNCPRPKQEKRAISIESSESGQEHFEAAAPSQRTVNSNIRVQNEIKSWRASQTLDYDGDALMSDYESKHRPMQRSSRARSNPTKLESHQQGDTEHLDRPEDKIDIKSPRIASPIEINGLSNPIDGLRARAGQDGNRQVREESPLFVNDDDFPKDPTPPRGGLGLGLQEAPSALQEYLKAMAARKRGLIGTQKKVPAKPKGTANKSRKGRGRKLANQQPVFRPALEQTSVTESNYSATDQDEYSECYQNETLVPSTVKAKTTSRAEDQDGSSGALKSERGSIQHLTVDAAPEVPMNTHQQDEDHGQSLEATKDNRKGLGGTMAPVYAAPGLSSIVSNHEGDHVENESLDPFDHPEQAQQTQKDGPDMVQYLSRFMEQNDKEIKQREKGLSDAQQRQELLDRQFLSEQANGVSREDKLSELSSTTNDAASRPPKLYSRERIQSLHAGKHTPSILTKTDKDIPSENTRTQGVEAGKATAPANPEKDTTRKSKAGEKNKPLDPRKITEADRILWRLKTGSSLKWEDVFNVWRREINGATNITSTNGLGGRYKKLQATVAKYGTLQPSDAQIAEYIRETSMQDTPSIIDSVPDSDRSFQDPTAESLRPNTGGKTLTVDMMRAYLAAIDEDVIQSDDDNDDEAVVRGASDQPRAPSPPREEDKCHWVYYVKRKVFRLSQDETDVEWIRVGPTFTNIKRANVESMLEITKERGDVDVWPLTSWHWTGDDGKGMSQHVGKSDTGTVLVSVDRYLRTFQHGRLPETREGFLKKEVYIVFVRTSSYVINGIANESHQHQPVEGDIDCTAGSESLNFETGFNGPTADVDVPYWNTVDLNELFDEISDLQANEQFINEQIVPTQEDPTWRFHSTGITNSDNSTEEQINPETQMAHEIPGTLGASDVETELQHSNAQVANKPYVAAQQPVVSNRTLFSMIQEPLQGVYSVLDAANRAAGHHLLELKRLQIPVTRRNKMDEVLAAQRSERQMNERLDQLEQTEEKFKDRMELDIHDDTISAGKQIKVVDVWVEERWLEAPRNI